MIHLAAITTVQSDATDPRTGRHALRRALGMLLILVLMTPLRYSHAQEDTAALLADRGPFVGAFERLARHGEISSTLAGRLLISELSCTACHASDNQTLRPKGGPDLAAAGSRLDPQWLQRFIADPTRVKPGTTMPDVLHAFSDQERSEIATALAAYLGSLRQPLADIKATGLHPVPHQFWNLGDAKSGRTLYHRVGCVACHEPDPQHQAAEIAASPTDQLIELLDPEELEQLGLASAARSGPVEPLAELAEKYSLRSLSLFLLDPEATRPGGRMPNFKLSAVDAAHIATYLMQRSSAPQASDDFTTADAAPLGEAAQRLVAEGRRLFKQLQCVNCHQSDDVTSEPTAPAFDQLKSRWTRGCLASPPHSDRGPAAVSPRFNLDVHQVEAIGSALSDRDALQNDQRLVLRFLQLNCYACHQRDGLGGVSRDRRAYFETVGHEDLGDEGRLPPPLSGVGRKATAPWLNRVLQGNGDIRPHMHARMPKFPAAAAKDLAARLIQVDRSAAADELADNPPPRRQRALATWPAAEDQQQVEAGRRMTDVGCVDCHSFRGQALPGVIGVDLSGIADRVEPQWFHEFLLNPGAIKPRTRMPSFFPDGKSQNAELLGGDPERQIAAMWGYLKTLSTQPLPAKLEAARANDFELRPQDRPILLRTFMPQAGTHAIAVGFPEQVHFALDADSLRLVSAWRGRFLDAQGTWFVRAAPPASPLGEDLITISEDDLLIGWDGFRDGAPQPQRRFLGYRLDQHGVPTFLYSLAGLQIEDRITPSHSFVAAAQAEPGPAGPMGLRRVLRLTKSSTEGHAGNLAQPLAVRLLTGRQLTAVDAKTFKNERGLMVTISRSFAGLARQRSGDNTASWVLPLWQTSDGAPDKHQLDANDEAETDDVIELEMRYQW